MQFVLSAEGLTQSDLLSGAQIIAPLNALVVGLSLKVDNLLNFFVCCELDRLTDAFPAFESSHQLGCWLRNDAGFVLMQVS